MQHHLGGEGISVEAEAEVEQRVDAESYEGTYPVSVTTWAHSTGETCHFLHLIDEA